MESSTQPANPALDLTWLNNDEISNEIINKLKRGLTSVRGQGAYSGQEKHILYVVISFQEVSRLKRLVRNIDPNAFVVISDTLEVMGQRIGNQPHW
jgi:uncharacterized membrane-anchored protein YitT (DUF2179 family)